MSSTSNSAAIRQFALEEDRKRKAAMRAERERCAKILDEEAQRGRDVLNLCDKDGSPFFDPRIMQACIEAIEYCAARIRADDEK